MKLIFITVLLLLLLLLFCRVFIIIIVVIMHVIYNYMPETKDIILHIAYIFFTINVYYIPTYADISTVNLY
jgi:hypothetical protein